ncbi:MAG: protein kinase [Candidatus Woesearchaeota archaeon]
MDDRKTIFIPQSDPLIGQKLGGIVKIITKIGTGGMCDVYLGEIDIHMYRAIRIIEGTLEPKKLGLDFPQGKIEDPEFAERVKAEARKWSEKFNKITRKLGDPDTAKIVQEGLLADTHEEFRAKGNLVAVKVLQQNYAKDLPDKNESSTEVKRKKRIRERFIKEGKVLKKLNHPNLIRSIETGYDEIGPEKIPVYFYVMEYVEQYNFSKHKEENPLPIETTIKIAKAVLKACDYIHNQNPPILHRDIKPSNILVDEETINQEEIDARLTDLGFAKIRDEDSSASAPKDISQSQEFAGTPNYVAPEQAQGLGAATPASDIWSVAATLYDLLTGHAPYETEEGTGFAVLSKILECKKPEPIRKYNQSVPQMLEDIILMNFTKNQEDRLCPAKEFTCALDDYTRLSKKDNTIESIKEKIKEKEKNLKKSKDKKSEELAELYYELLYKIERKFIDNLPDQNIIKERINTLNKIIEKTTGDENRINFLKKYRKYEEIFLIKKDPSTAVELPKKRSKLGLTAAALATVFLGTIGWFVADTYKRHSEISRIHRNIKAELANCEFNINKDNLDAANTSLTKIKTDRSSLPKNFNTELDQQISNIEKKYIHRRNEKIYLESETAINTARIAFNERKFAKAKTDADIAENKIKQLITQDSDEYKNKQAEISKEITELKKKLADKDEAIRTFDFVKESYERINRMYENFKADLENEKLFEKKEIDMLKKKIETHKNTLAGVEEEFQDENKNALQEYKDLETKIEELNIKISE